MNQYVHRAGSLIAAHSVNQTMATSNEYNDHVHPFYEMFYFIEGDIEYVVEDRRYELRPHEVLLIRPGEHHYFRIRSDRKYERMLVFFSDEDIPDAIAPLIKQKGSLFSVGDTGLEELFTRMDAHAEEYSGEALEILLRSWFMELITRLACLDREEIQPQRVKSGITAIADYIADNITQPLTIDDLCRAFGVSRSYLSKAFTESFHEPPKQYIIRKKITLAQQLLSSGERPISVSERCGFSDYSTFYRAFTRIMGMPPSAQLRETNWKDPWNG